MLPNWTMKLCSSDARSTLFKWKYRMNNNKIIKFPFSSFATHKSKIYNVCLYTKYPNGNDLTHNNGAYSGAESGQVQEKWGILVSITIKSWKWTGVLWLMRQPRNSMWMALRRRYWMQLNNKLATAEKQECREMCASSCNIFDAIRHRAVCKFLAHSFQINHRRESTVPCHLFSSSFWVLFLWQ